MMSNLRLPRLRRAKALPHRIQSSVDVSRLAVALPAVSVTKVDVSRPAGRSPGYFVPAKIPSPLPADHRDIPSQLRYRVLSGLGKKKENNAKQYAS